MNNQGVVRITVNSGGRPPAGSSVVWTSNPITKNSDLNIDVSYSKTDRIMNVKLSGALDQTAAINNVTLYRNQQVPGRDEWSFDNSFTGPLNVPVFASGTGSKQPFSGVVKYLYIGDPPAAATAGASSSGPVRGPGPGWNL